MRFSSPILDTMIGHKLPVLSKGFVRVVDYMGNDRSIVQAARISYGAGTKTSSEDETLIRYLMRHRHTTPFEMCELKLHVKVPMDCWRQWIRHRTASVNEYSTRYSEAIDDMETTEPDKWRSQSKSNKQGSEEFIESGTAYQSLDSPGNEFDSEGRRIGFGLTRRERQVQEMAREIYQERLESNVAREQARKDLPLSTYTEAYWKINLHNLFHFLSLRMDSHAQKEIREYATVIGEKIVAEWVPMAWQAFVDYRLEGMFLSRLEIGGIREGFDGSLIDNRRENDEFEKKMIRLGLR